MSPYASLGAWNKLTYHGSLARRYVKLWVAHAPRMPGTFSPPLGVSDPVLHHGTGVTHVPWCMSGSLTSGLLWSRWWGKRSRHSRRMHNPQFYVSGRSPCLVLWNLHLDISPYSCGCKTPIVVLIQHKLCSSLFMFVLMMLSNIMPWFSSSVYCRMVIIIFFGVITYSQISNYVRKTSTIYRHECSRSIMLVVLKDINMMTK